MSERKIAALYVATGGAYFGLPGVEPWDAVRDARLYPGPWPVVAHPPCQRWGRYWFGGPSSKVRKIKGDDGGCFASALSAVRTWGGVLEHPEASAAWATFGLIAPPRDGGWVAAGDWRGWTCCVEQGHYGHRARKATWLYCVNPRELQPLRWGKAEGRIRLEDGCRSKEARAARIGVGLPRITEHERIATPLPFRDLLISIARSCNASTNRMAANG